MAEGPDLYEVRLLPGRGEAHVRLSPGDGAEPAEKSFQSGDDGRSLRVEPGNSYLVPASLWDRFSGSRRGPFRIRVTTRASEAVLASGRQVGRTVGPGGEFVSAKETARRCRFEIWQPSLMDRQIWATWEAEGGLTMEKRIRKRLLQILETHRPEPLPEGVPAQIEAILEETVRRQHA